MKLLTPLIIWGTIIIVSVTMLKEPIPTLLDALILLLIIDLFFRSRS